LSACTLPAPEDWSFDGKMREQMWPEEGQLDGAWMEMIRVCMVDGSST
jgi:hypothetical protein